MMLVLGDRICAGPMDTLCLSLACGFKLKLNNIFIMYIFQRYVFVFLFIPFSVPSLFFFLSAVLIFLFLPKYHFSFSSSSRFPIFILPPALSPPPLSFLLFYFLKLLLFEL